MMAAAMELASASKCRITDWAANPAEDYVESVDLEFCKHLREKLRKLKKEKKEASGKKEDKLKKSIKALEKEINDFEADDKSVAKALVKALADPKAILSVVKYITYLHFHNHSGSKGSLSCDKIVPAFGAYLEKEIDDSDESSYALAQKYLKNVVKPIYEIESWRRQKESYTEDGKRKSINVSSEKALLLHLHMAFMLNYDIFDDLKAMLDGKTVKKYMSKYVSGLKEDLEKYSADYKLYKKGKLIKSLYKRELDARASLEKVSAREIIMLQRETFREIESEIGSEELDEKKQEIAEQKIKAMHEREKSITRDLAAIQKPGIPVFCIDKHTAEGGKRFTHYAGIIQHDYFSKVTGDKKKITSLIKGVISTIHFVNVKAVLANEDPSMKNHSDEWFLQSEFAELKLNDSS